MGPTQLWPETHAEAFHALDDDARAAHLRSHPPVAAELKRGEGILFDSLLFHRGGANSSTRRRSLLSVSLAPNSDDATFQGTTDSIFDLYRGKFALGDFATPPP